MTEPPELSQLFASIATAGKAGAAAQHAAAQCGGQLTPQAAREVVRAVLGVHDTTMTVRQSARREHWTQTHYREGVTRLLLRDLAVRVAEAGCVPLTAPRQAIRYQRTWPVPVVVSMYDEPWDAVLVELSVPVRQVVEGPPLGG